MILFRIVAVFLMIAAGFAARKRRLLDGETTTRLSRLVVALFYPALIYAVLVREFTFSSLLRHWPLPAGAALIMLVGFVLGAAASRLLRFSDERRRRTFHFQCTINNYSFLPMPLALLFWGNRGVANLIFSTVGSEISVWTLGMLALTGGRLRWSNLRHLITPPMLAIVAAVASLVAAESGHLPFSSAPRLRDLWSSCLSAMDMFGKATVPLAMLVAGSRMAELRARQLFDWGAAAVVMIRMLVVPACAAALLTVLPFPSEARQVLFVVAVMPCAIASVLLSDVYGGDSDFAAVTVFSTHLAALAAIPVWLHFLL